MANSLLENLSAAAALSGSDLFYVKQGGARGLKATGTQFLTLVGTTYLPLAGGTMTGVLTVPAGSVSDPSIKFTSAASGTGFYTAGSNSIAGAVNGVNSFTCTSTYFYVAGTTGIGFISDTASVRWGSSLATDPILTRGGAGTLYLRPVTTSTECALRISTLYTDASNYERLTLTGVAGASVNITAETLGTGSDNLDIVLSPAGTGYVRISSPTTLMRFSVANARIDVSRISADFNATDLTLDCAAAKDVIFKSSTTELARLTSTGAMQLPEVTAPAAPSANNVRIYAEDNGAGKTRLMALFATGSAVQIAIEP